MYKKDIRDLSWMELRDCLERKIKRLEEWRDKETTRLSKRCQEAQEAKQEIEKELMETVLRREDTIRKNKLDWEKEKDHIIGELNEVKNVLRKVIGGSWGYSTKIIFEMYLHNEQPGTKIQKENEAYIHKLWEADKKIRSQEEQIESLESSLSFYLKE